MKYVIPIILIFVQLIFVHPQSEAAVFDVKTANELHDALKIAAGNGEDDLIKVYEGTYYGNFIFQQGLSEQGKLTRIFGGYNSDGEKIDDPTKTILDGSQKDRVLYCNLRGSIIIINLTFQNGRIGDNAGGGLAITHHPVDEPGSIFLGNNIFRNNRSDKMGGGLYAESSADKGTAGNIWLFSNQILNNITEGSSGGGAYLHILTGSISNTTGQILVFSNTISENTASKGPGGGLYIWSRSNTGTAGKVFVGLNTVRDNSAGGPSTDGGGGICIISNSAVGVADLDMSHLNSITLTKNTIEDNGTGDIGGGVFIRAKTGEGISPAIIFEKNNISSNTAVGSGGGVEAITTSPGGIGGKIKFNGNMVSNNSVGDADKKGHGGGIRLASTGSGDFFSGEVILTNNIIVENSSNYFDGGAAINGEITLTNNTIANNQAIMNAGGAFLFCVNTVKVYNNIIWGNSPADIRLGGFGVAESYHNDYSGSPGVWATEVDRIDVDPLFVGPHDYHLQSTSPCKNGGTAGAPYLPAEDFDGDDRIIWGVPDIGADEILLGLAPGFYPEFKYKNLLPPQLQEKIQRIEILERKK